jgi:hypothetical protein
LDCRVVFEPSPDGNGPLDANVVPRYIQLAERRAASKQTSHRLSTNVTNGVAAEVQCEQSGIVLEACAKRHCTRCANVIAAEIKCAQSSILAQHVADRSCCTGVQSIG